MLRAILVGQRFALLIERDQWALPDGMRRAEIKHAPRLRLARLAQRMAEIAPRQADRNLGMGQRLAKQACRAQHVILLLRMLQDQDRDLVVDRGFARWFGHARTYRRIGDMMSP
jgi:hypothetical protein